MGERPPARLHEPPRSFEIVEITSAPRRAGLGARQARRLARRRCPPASRNSLISRRGELPRSLAERRDRLRMPSGPPREPLRLVREASPPLVKLPDPSARSTVRKRVTPPRSWLPSRSRRRRRATSNEPLSSSRPARCAKRGTWLVRTRAMLQLRHPEQRCCSRRSRRICKRTGREEGPLTYKRGVKLMARELRAAWRAPGCRAPPATSS
jgi:hypothetical protein